MADVELTGDLANIHRFPFEGECGVPRYHMERGDLAQIGDDIFADPITEVFLLRVAAHVRERQHTDGWTFWFLALRRRRDAGAINRLHAGYFLWRTWIAGVVGIKIENVNAHIMLHVAFPQVVQM